MFLRNVAPYLPDYTATVTSTCHSMAGKTGGWTEGGVIQRPSEILSFSCICQST